MLNTFIFAFIFENNKINYIIFCSIFTAAAALAVDDNEDDDDDDRESKIFLTSKELS